MAIGVQVRNVINVAAQSGDGYYVYPHAHASGGTLLHRVTDDGVEDFVSFDTRPAMPEVVYDLALDKGVSGLRMVEGTLEMMDDDGNAAVTRGAAVHRRRRRRADRRDAGRGRLRRRQRPRGALGAPVTRLAPTRALCGSAGPTRR